MFREALTDFMVILDSVIRPEMVLHLDVYGAGDLSLVHGQNLGCPFV